MWWKVMWWFYRLASLIPCLTPMALGCQVAEAALADEHVRGGERLDLQRRILRLGKPPRRWKTPPWASSLPRDPPEVRLPPASAPCF